MYIAQNKIKKLSFGTIRNKWLDIKLSSVKFVAKSREIGMMRGANDCFQLDISLFLFFFLEGTFYTKFKFT